MKKIFVFLMVLCMLFFAAACSSGEEQQTPQSFTEQTEQSETGSALLAEQQQVGYRFLLDGVAVEPNAVFPIDQLPEALECVQIPSCAFEGEDEVYTYEMAEVTVHEQDGEPIVYSVYLLDPSAVTEEGISLGDTRDDMIAAYSSDYEEVGAECIYQKADTQLCFILQDDVIISIEYRIADENAF